MKDWLGTFQLPWGPICWASRQCTFGVLVGSLMVMGSSPTMVLSHFSVSFHAERIFNITWTSQPSLEKLVDFEGMFKFKFYSYKPYGFLNIHSCISTEFWHWFEQCLFCCLDQFLFLHICWTLLHGDSHHIQCQVCFCQLQ